MRNIRNVPALAQENRHMTCFNLVLTNSSVVCHVMLGCKAKRQHSGGRILAQAPLGATVGSLHKLNALKPS